MNFCSEENGKKKVLVRLNRIEGQVRGIHKMVSDNKDCMAILNQIVSTQSALKGVWKEVVRGHLNNCVADAVRQNKKSETLIDELMAHIEQLR